MGGKSEVSGAIMNGEGGTGGGEGRDGKTRRTSLQPPLHDQ